VQTAANRPTIVWSLHTALVLAAAGVALAGGIEIVQSAYLRLGPTGVLTPVAGFLYAAAGLVAWWRRPSNRLGVIMFSGGLLWLLSGLVDLDAPVLIDIGIVLATVPIAVIVHLLHAFPSGRLRTPLPRWTVGAGYAVCLLLQVPLYLFAPSASPNGTLAIADRPGLLDAGIWLQRGAGLSVMAVTAAVLAVRLAGATRRQRRVLAPLYLYGIVAVIAVPLVASVVRPLTGISPTTTGIVQVAILAAAPLGFASAVLLGGFARTSEIQELGAWLGRDVAQRPALAEALSHALGDPSLQLAFWIPERSTFVDAEGQPMVLDEIAIEPALVDVELGSRRVGAILYDATLIDDPELVRAAGRVVALAIDQQRLDVELRASQQQLQRSRARVIEAADRERERIARDLHDGLQAELVLLAVEAQRLASQPATPAVTAAAAIQLRARIDGAAAELRQLVHAVMPAGLIERGLTAATEDLIDRMPVPTTLDVDVTEAEQLPPLVQSTAYFVIAEALANAVKHARPNKIVVRIERRDHHLTIDIRDDGIGGAQPGAGLGLRGLTDRIDVLGGRLDIESPEGQGTQIVARLPCES
jgi:signal transduction histidine kinase